MHWWWRLATVGKTGSISTQIEFYKNKFVSSWIRCTMVDVQILQLEAEIYDFCKKCKLSFSL